MQPKTPEDRLLELIDNPSMKKRARREAVSIAFDMRAFIARIAAFKASVFSLWSLRWANKIIAAFCAGLVVLLMTMGQFSAKQFARRFYRAFDLRGAVSDISVDRYAAFSIPSDARGLRSFSTEGSVAAKETGPQQERLSRIVLVGIIEDRGTRQAVLEDSATAQTVLVKPGDTHEGFTVTSVGSDAVTVTDGARTWEIR